MKIYILVLGVIIFCSAATFGQGDALPPAAAKKAVETIPREKFDPTRDPKIDLATAVATATGSGRRIILDVGGEWCGWCVYMDKFFYQNPALAKLRDDNYVWVKVNFSDANENVLFLSTYPSISGYPHLFVLDGTGKLLRSQDTSPLEEGKGYNLAKFTEFLTAWAPKRTR